MDSIQRDALLKHLSRRLARLDDEELIKVEEVSRPQHERNAPLFSRRLFIRLGLVGGATAAGAAALKLLESSGTAARTAPSPATVQPGGSSYGLMSTPECTAEQLTGVNAQLDQANEEIVSLRASLSEVSQQKLALQSQLDAALNDLAGTRTQLDTVQRQAGLLAGLVGLYEQLDGIRLDETVQNGLAAAAAQIDNAVQHSAVVQAGVTAAHGALDALQAALPQAKSWMEWLGAATGWVVERMHEVQVALGDTVAASRAFTEMLGAFFMKILSLLPFGWGDPIKRGLDSIGVLLNGLPEMATGINDYMLPQVAGMFNPDDPQYLATTVVTPVKDNALAPAATLAQDVTNTQATYTSQLATPAQDAIGRVAAKRGEIAAYRQANNI